MTKFLATSRPAGLSFSPGAIFLLPSLSFSSYTMIMIIKWLQRHQGSRWIRPPMHSWLPQSARIAFRAERWNLQFSNNTIILDDNKWKFQRSTQSWANKAFVALSSEQSPPNPSLRLHAITPRRFFRHIFLGRDSTHNIYQNTKTIEICTEDSPERFVHEGIGKC